MLNSEEHVKADGPASAEDIAALQELVGLEIPEDYLRFLSETNGGRPFRQYIAVPAPWGLNSSVISEFFHAGADDYYGVISAYTSEVESHRIPPKSLPIAEDVFGNRLLLSCEDASFGEVFFWDHERSYEVPDGRSIHDFRETVTKVADSFSDLLMKRLLDRESLNLEMQRLAELPLPPMPEPVPVEAWSPPIEGIVGQPGSVQVYSSDLMLHRQANIERIYRILLPDEYLEPVPLADGWEPPVVAVESKVDGPLHLDFLARDNQLILRESAKAVMGDYLCQFGELLPLESNEGTLYLFHSFVQVDALSPGSYTVKGSSTFLKKGYQFAPEVIADLEIFSTLPGDMRDSVFFTRKGAENFTLLAAEHGLSHIPLLKVWPDN